MNEHGTRPVAYHLAEMNHFRRRRWLAMVEASAIGVAAALVTWALMALVVR